jgi:transcriptional regulator with PAS, ATPase and Fis domain
MDKGILPRVIDSLCQYPYSGNVREMSNIMEQLVVLSQDDIIQMEDLPDHVRHPHADADDWLDSGASNLSHAVERVEKTLILHALKSCGTQRKAAHLLGINQSTLARKAKRYGIAS